MGWVEAGQGWGARAKEWAYLFEPYARTANELIFDRIGAESGTALLDVACGSGFAASLAAARGCTVTGLDAADPLLEIARARTPTGTFVCGDMFAMPFSDGTFDAATSFNGIWKGCEQALSETNRVLKPGGRVGLTFWGPFDRLGLLPYFMKVMELSAESHGGAMMTQGDTGSQGVIEDMFSATGFEFVDRGTVEVVNEWPDVATAVRAMAAAGPSVPAIENVGYDAFVDALTDVVAPVYSDTVGVRISSEFGWVTARAT
jgi:ubiquinone/menaquinone biosynthesis C-methylase UbiE